MVKPVAIYADLGTSEVGILSLEKRCQTHLNRPSKRLLSREILHGELKQYAALFVPGGADLPYCEKLNGAGNRHIRDFVADGGFYLGICAGAYYACSALAFVGADYHVFGERELAFFEGTAKGSLPNLTNGYYFSEAVQSKAMVNIQWQDFPPHTTACYYHGGCTFEPDPQAIRKAEILARYPSGQTAVIRGEFGQGNYLLSGVHFELDAECYRQQICQKASKNDRLLEEKIYQELKTSENHQIWQQIHRLIG